MPPAAIIKFGSTSTTLLIAERVDRPIVRHQHLLDLLSPAGRHRVLTLARQLRMTAEYHAANPLAAGGEALRRDPDIEKALAEIFPHWWHLSADMEGRLAWLAVKSRHSACDLVVDLGGGSTEFIAPSQVWSIPEGAAQPPYNAPLPSVRSFGRPVFIGGTAVALKRWIGRDRLTSADAHVMREALQHSPDEFPHIDNLRLRILPRGLDLLARIVEDMGWNEFEVSERGLTEGLWLAASLGRGSRA